MTYNPGQVEVLYKYLKQIPDWLILGGPADGDESQVLKKRFPNLKVLAFEPCRDMFDWQLANGFPKDGILLPVALTAKEGEVRLREAGRSSSIGRSVDCTQISSTQSITLDSIYKVYGPFKSAIVWLDIEGSELEAIEGASKMMSARGVQIVNVEMLREAPDRNRRLDAIIRKYGFRYADNWDVQSGNHYDSIYVRVS